MKSKSVSNAEAAKILRSFLGRPGQAAPVDAADGGGLEKSGHERGPRKPYSPADTGRLLRALEADLVDMERQR